MTTAWHGPAAWEAPAPRRYGPVGRVAAVSDVHANVAALTSVLADIEAAGVDLIVSCGDLTWGSHPDDTIAIMRRLGARALFVRGNGERAVLEIAGGRRTAESPREAWVPALRQMRYDVTAALAAGTGSGDPAAEKITELLMSPPSPEEIMAETERLIFSD